MGLDVILTIMEIVGYSTGVLSLILAIFFLLLERKNIFSKKVQPFMIVYQRSDELKTSIDDFYCVDFAKSAEKAADKAKRRLESYSYEFQSAKVWKLDPVDGLMYEIAKFDKHAPLKKLD